MDLLKADGISPARKASTHGGEYASKCPWCGGKDRFLTWPTQENGGNYWCRKCGKKGNVIRYLMEYRGMKYQDACNLLGQIPSPKRSIENNKTPQTGTWTANAPSNSPPAKWQTRAEKLVKWAEECLWNPLYVNIPKELNNRGLKDQAIRNAKLGWIPRIFIRKGNRGDCLP